MIWRVIEHQGAWRLVDEKRYGDLVMHGDLPCPVLSEGPDSSTAKAQALETLFQQVRADRHTHAQAKHVLADVERRHLVERLEAELALAQADKTVNRTQALLNRRLEELRP